MTDTEPAPAKLNLALHVRARRADGYHELETLFACAGMGDVVRLTDGPLGLAIDGPFAPGLEADDGNLVLRAAHAFAGAFGDPPSGHFLLTKHLPVASGIGGGSADAAAALRLLARRDGVAPEDPALVACAEALGSDVPACLLGRTAIGRGRGEALQQVSSLDGVPVLLVNPQIALSTATVFGRWDGTDRGPLPPGDPLTTARAGRNDLEAPAIALAPVIGQVLAALRATPDPALVRMSGSGATCFALYHDEAARDAAAATLCGDRPDWWCLATTLG